MVKLYGFGSNFGLTDASPFVLKLHTWLKMARLEYKTVNRFSNMQKAPKGKLPFIEDGKITLGDSAMIIKHLENQYVIDLDHWLNPEQKVISFMISKTLEEYWYWCLIYSRWIDDDCWPVVEQEFFRKLSFPLRKVLPFVARRGIMIGAHKQGISRHSREEVIALTEETAANLSTLLEGRMFVMGDQLANVDATVFGFLAQFVLTKFDNPYNEAVRRYANLLRYCQNMQSTFFN